MQPLFKYKIPVHIAGWILLFAVPLLLSPAREFASILAEPSNIISIIVRNVLWMGLFYANLFYFTPLLLQKKHAGLLLVGLALAVVVVTLVNSRLHHLFSQQFNPDFARPDGLPMPGDQPPGFPNGSGFGNRPPFDPRHRMRFGPPGPFFVNTIISIAVVSVSTSIVLWEEWIKARAEEQERAFQKVASELAVLKLQISPHFLFNTLNNIRWLIRSRSDQAEASVIKLSSLLRYLLYQTDQEKVPLDKEAEHLSDYVALQKMRLEDTSAVFFSSDGVKNGQMIVPLLLIPLVENVFKYGEFTDAYENKIVLEVQDDLLIFKTINKVIAIQEERTGKDYGIGLANVRRRLALHYPNKHSLKYAEADGIFKLDLEIILT